MSAFWDFHNDAKKQEAFFGQNYERYQILGCEVTGNCKGTTARLRYKNDKGELQSFQFGNGLLRYVFGKNGAEQWTLRSNLYHNFATYILGRLGPFFHDPHGYLTRMDTEELLPIPMKLAINQWDDGTHAPPAFHSDGTVEAACLTSAMPSDGSNKLDSTQKANCDAGGLCHKVGGFIFPYGQWDAMIFNGTDLHGPTSPCLLNQSKDANNRVGRNSFVTFLKFDKNKDEKW